MTNSTGAEFRNDGRSHSGLPAATVKRLARIDPRRAGLAVIRTYLVIVLSVAAALVWWSPWIIVPAIIVIATQQHGLFIIGHDAAHYRLFGSRLWNEWVGRLSASLVGLSMPTYRVVHRLHHNHLLRKERSGHRAARRLSPRQALPRQEAAARSERGQCLEDLCLFLRRARDQRPQRQAQPPARRHRAGATPGRTARSLARRGAAICAARGGGSDRHPGAVSAAVGWCRR